MTKTVLYVEDNPVNILLVQAIFDSRPSIRLLTATDGSAGLALARTERPDLILLDLNLPDMDGQEFLSNLKADPAIGSIPVVIVSADTPGEQEMRFRDLGVADYLTKPFDLRQFEQIIDRHVGPEATS